MRGRVAMTVIVTALTIFASTTKAWADTIVTWEPGDPTTKEFVTISLISGLPFSGSLTTSELTTFTLSELGKFKKIEVFYSSKEVMTEVTLPDDWSDDGNKLLWSNPTPASSVSIFGINGPVTYFVSKIVFTIADPDGWVGGPDFVSNGIKYRVTSEDPYTVMIVDWVDSKPTGNLAIPAIVSDGSGFYTVTSMRPYVFRECTGLTSVTIPASMTSIADYAFMSCTGLASVTFAEGSQLESIGNNAFYECTSLQSITIPATVTSIGGAFGECSKLSSVNIPSGIKEISDCIFWRCTKLTSIDIPSGVTSIGGSAFAETGLTTVNIPASVASIGQHAFANCPDLTLVTMNSVPHLGSGIFDDSNKATIRFSLTAHSAGGAYWTTIYLNQITDFTVDANTQIFKATLNGSTVKLTEWTADKDVRGQMPAILKSTSSPIILTHTNVSSGNNYLSFYSDNSLIGVGVENADSVAANGSIYVLNDGAAGLGFYKLATGYKVGPGKAYLEYSGTDGAREFFGFDKETTALPLVNREKSIEDSEVYDLLGRRVENPKKGLYISNGRKVVIK